MPARGTKRPVRGNDSDPHGLLAWSRRYVESLRVRGDSERAMQGRISSLNLFAEWAHERSIDRPSEVTRGVLKRYARHCFEVRKSNGHPLTSSTQRQRLQALRMLFRYLVRERVLEVDPASDLELPKVGRRLPRSVLTQAEVDKVLALPDPTTALGLRDRCMMEVLFATGMRRFELTGLVWSDIDHERKSIVIREGKGKKDRVVPMAKRTRGWLDRYRSEARPRLLVPPDDGFVFVGADGRRLPDWSLTALMGRYVKRAEIGKAGCVHVFRHTMATLMLEAGADLRVIQEILGHTELSTTQLYTSVSIGHLRAVYDKTHPSARDGAEGASDEAEA